MKHIKEKQHKVWVRQTDRGREREGDKQVRITHYLIFTFPVEKESIFVHFECTIFFVFLNIFRLGPSIKNASLLQFLRDWYNPLKFILFCHIFVDLPFLSTRISQLKLWKFTKTFSMKYSRNFSQHFLNTHKFLYANFNWFTSDFLLN